MLFRSATPRVLAIFLLALTAPSWGGGDDCVTGTPVWQNSAIGPFAGLLVVTWEATPSEQDMDGVVALSMGAGGVFADYACLVRFNEGTGATEDGTIDVRNGNTYQADAQVLYVPDRRYDFRAEIDIAANTYSVWVTTFGPETQIASNYAFRTEQQGIGALDNWGAWSGIGSLTVCDFLVSYDCGIVPPPPAGTIFVNASNPACPGAGTAVNPYCRIQDAICVASNGDEIVLAPGTYFETIDLLGKAITVRGSGGAAVTTIDGTGLDGSVITCSSGEGPATVIEGLTVTGGSTGTSIFNDNYTAGGGAFFDGSSPTVRECTFVQNTAGLGGAIFAQASSPLIESCRFDGNVSTVSLSCAGGGSGGALYVKTGSGTTSSPIVRACTFVGNTASGPGGAVWSDSSTTQIEDCVLRGNVAVMGGGVGGSGIVRGCTFDSNVATRSGGGIVVGDGFECSLESYMEVVTCLFVGNRASVWGGGLYEDFELEPGGLVLMNSRFVGNTACCGGALNIYRSNPLIANCQLSGNVATSRGGAIEIYEASPTIANCTIVANSALEASVSTGGGAIWKDVLGRGDVSNSIVWGNGADPIVAPATFPGEELVFVSSVIEFYEGTEPTVIADQPPRLVDVCGLDGIVGTADDDVRVFINSPAIDAGDNAAVAPDTLDLDGDGNTTEPTPFDLAGNPRFADEPTVTDTGIGTPPIVDMGAYEWVRSGVNPSGPRWWSDPLGGAYLDSGNWAPDTTPTIQDHAIFDLDATYAVTFGAVTQVNRLRVLTGDVTFDLGGTSFQLGATDGAAMTVAPCVESPIGAQLTLSNGSLVGSEVLVGDRDGRLEIEPGATLEAPVVVVRGDGVVSGTGMIMGTVTNLARVDPGGDGVGTLTVAGDYTDVGALPNGTDAAGIMEVTVERGTRDELLVAGIATLGGTLSIDLFDPPVDTAIPVLTAGQITGVFQGRIVGTALGGRTLQVQYVDDRVELVVREINLAAIWDDGGDYSIGSDVVPTDAVLADFNNDTLPDIALSLPGDLDQVYVFFNNGKGSDPNDIFNDAPGQFCIVSVGDDPIALDAADLDDDGWLDLAVVNASGNSLQILINDQQECFTPPGPAETTAVDRPTDVIAMIADADTVPDLAVSSLGVIGLQVPQEAVVVYTNSGDGLNYGEQRVPVSGRPVALAAGRITDPLAPVDDLAVVLNGTNEVQLLENNGTGTVNTTSPIAVGTEPCYIEPEDIDRDGLLDLVIVNFGSSTLSVLVSKDGGIFDPTLSFVVGDNPTSVTFADDGARLALITTDASGERVVDVYRNESEPDLIVLELDEKRFVGENPVIIRAADVNRDGSDDLIAITDPSSSALAGGGAGGGGVGPPPFAGFAAELQAPPCRADTDGSGSVGFNDLTGLLSAWGQSDVLYDLDENGTVGFGDLTILLNAWGPCP